MQKMEQKVIVLGDANVGKVCVLLLLFQTSQVKVGTCSLILIK